jgi:hypothetical protein
MSKPRNASAFEKAFVDSCVVPVRDFRLAASDPNAMAALKELEQDALAKSRSCHSGIAASKGGNQYSKSSGQCSRVSASRSAAAAAAEGAQYGKSTGLGAPQLASAAQRASLRAV